jgi:hypothetical protein
MRSLVPCSSCNRHVAAEETGCPFCGVALTPLDSPPCSGACAGNAFPRVRRAALIAAGAALLGAGCHDDTKRNVYPPYGIPPYIDAGSPSDAPPDSGDAQK